MKKEVDIQTRLLEKVKEILKGKDSFGHVMSEVLHISQDAVYRRSRNDTPLTVQEVEKLCKHFNISFDDLVEKKELQVKFQYSPLYNYDFSMENYLEGMLNGLKHLKSCTEPTIMLTVNNIPIFQLLNFPHLMRFRLYFWAKSHLQIEEYKEELFEEKKLTDNAYQTGLEILKEYCSIPSKECYDPEFLKGLMRQIQYYSNAHLFKDPHYPLQLLDEISKFVLHIKEQTVLGKKFVYRQDPELADGDFEVYLNDTINSDNTFYYTSEERSGLYVAHNHMNFLHTEDTTYVQESKSILDKQFANSSLISKVNEQHRNKFFFQIEKNIEIFRRKIEADLIL